MLEAHCIWYFRHLLPGNPDEVGAAAVAFKTDSGPILHYKLLCKIMSYKFQINNKPECACQAELELCLEAKLAGTAVAIERREVTVT